MRRKRRSTTDAVFSTETTRAAEITVTSGSTRKLVSAAELPPATDELAALFAEEPHAAKQAAAEDATTTGDIGDSWQEHGESEAEPLPNALRLKWTKSRHSSLFQ